MLKKFKYLTLGLGLIMTMGLVGCDTDAGITAILEEALATPTLAIKNNGAALEALEDGSEEIDGAIILLRNVKVYDEEADIEYDVTIEWSYPEETEANWNPLKERTDMPGLVTDTSIYLAVPRLPAFGEEAVATALIATATLEDKSLEKQYPISIQPEEVDVSTIPLMELDAPDAPKDAPLNDYGAKMVRVRGYLTRYMLDWNSAYIHNGDAGIALYRLDSSPDLIAMVDIGDYIELLGQFSQFAGNRQISYITRLTHVTPDENALEPVATTLTEDNWDDLAVGDDGRIVRVEGLVFDAEATGTINMSSHFTFKMKLGTKTIDLRVNYHIDLTGTMTRRDAIRDIVTAAVDGATVTFEGALGWYDGPQLLPIPETDVTLVPAP